MTNPIKSSISLDRLRAIMAETQVHPYVFATVRDVEIFAAAVEAEVLRNLLSQRAPRGEDDTKLDAFTWQGCERIDAAMFSGDVLHSMKNRADLKAYASRWLRRIAEFDAMDEPLPNGQYYAEDGTLMTAEGVRSVFDDVDE